MLRQWRENMVEAAAEAGEELMEKYLEEGDLSEEDIIRVFVSTRSTVKSNDALWFCI